MENYMRVVDIAQQIHSEISYDTSTSIPAIAYWIRGQLGRINNLLFEKTDIFEEDYLDIQKAQNRGNTN